MGTILNKFAVLSLLTLGAATATGCGSRSAPPKPASQGAAQTESETAGKELYEKNCAACHGTNLMGGLKIGSATSADIRWSSLKRRYTSPLLQRAVLRGLDEKGQPLDTAMPHWQGQLTKKQIDQIVAYLKTK